MPTVRFINTTHQNCHFRPFPPEALQFWREHGSLVGQVLRPESALTFAELAAAILVRRFGKLQGWTAAAPAANPGPACG